MKNFFSLFCLALFCLGTNQSFCQTSKAEEPITRFTEYAYMKVMPGKDDEYVRLEKAWKKIHLAKKKAGKIDDWSFSRIISPSGANTEYDYVTRNTFLGEDMYAATFTDEYMPANWKSLLTLEELELVSHTEEIRTLVKSETWVIIDEVWAEDVKTNAKVFAVNYFSIPKGKSNGDHSKVELDLWKPIHAARVKAGTMKGWVLMDMMLPYGESLPYSSVTIDGYADMRQFLTPWTEDYFKQVHPGKDINAMFKQTTEACTLVKGELRMMIDRLSW